MPRDGEIGANRQPLPIKGTPRQKQAKRTSIALTDATPASAPILGSAEGDVGARLVACPIKSPPHVATIVTDLAALQKRRKFCIRQQSQADRSIESLIASTMGFRIDATEKERKAVFAGAKTHRLAVEKGGEGQGGGGSQAVSALSAITPLILVSASNRGNWDGLRKNVETAMIALATQLPVYAWAKHVKGFGDKGLAIIAGEAGIPIGDYRTVEGLWKRNGVAVIDGERQRKKTDKAQAAAHGYSPKRRSELWTLAASMIKHQWNAEKLRCRCSNQPTNFECVDGAPVCEKCGAPGISADIIPAHAAGPYGEVYAVRKAHTLPRIAATADLDSKSPDKWTAGRCNNDAVRIMSKALLRDLWVEWRRATAN